MSPLQPQPPYVHAPIPEANQLIELHFRFIELGRLDEPPLWSKSEHNAWEQKREDFEADVLLLQEDVQSLVKQWLA